VVRRRSAQAEIDWDRLVEAAWQARERAHAPYSDFAVGAALLGRSGRVYRGCNVENASLGLTLCAERGAVVCAVAEGEREFDALAICADAEEPVPPCGACRQVIAEFARDLPMLLVTRNGRRAARLSELLPSPFQARRA
jgi:cytidine deaminase